MKNFIKNIFFLTLVMIIFFGILEAQQRVRYYLKEKDIYYLCYGINGINRNIQNLLFIMRKKVDRKTSELTIDCHGGSTTRFPNLKLEDNYPALLEEKLSEKFPEMTIGVNNYAHGGRDTDGILHTMRVVYCDPEKVPDILIVYSGLNEYYHYRGITKKVDDYYLRNRYVIPNFWLRVDKNLQDYSLFYLCFKEKIHLLKDKKLDNYYKNQPRVAIVQQKITEQQMQELGKMLVEKYKRNLNSIIDLACILKIKNIIFMSIPISKAYEKKQAEALDVVQLFVEMFGTMESVARERGVVFIDVKKYVEHLPERDDYFKSPGDGLHMNKEGNLITAQFAADACSNIISSEKDEMLSSVHGDENITQ